MFINLNTVSYLHINNIFGFRFYWKFCSMVDSPVFILCFFVRTFCTANQSNGVTLELVRWLINGLIGEFYKVEFPVAVQDQSEDASLFHVDATASDVSGLTFRHSLCPPINKKNT